MLCPLVTGEAFSDLRSFSSSSAQSAQRHLPASSQLLCTCRFVTNLRSLHFIFAFCVALRSPSVFGSRLSVTSVSPPSQATHALITDRHTRHNIMYFSIPTKKKISAFLVNSLHFRLTTQFVRCLSVTGTKINEKQCIVMVCHNDLGSCCDSAKPAKNGSAILEQVACQHSTTP